MCFRLRREARRPPPDDDRTAGAGLVVHRLRDHVQDHQTGDGSPGIFDIVQEVRRPAAGRAFALRAAALRVFGPDDGRRFRNPQQRVQQEDVEKDLNPD